MRKVLISLAAAAATLAVAAPASAQVYGAPRYNAPYGNAYGYGYGNIRALQMRVDAIQRQINVLDRRNILSNREARRLREQSRDLERRLHQRARNGLSPREMQNIQIRIARLEQRVQIQARDWNRR
jgi:predicted RNase H-like nuclease (RuvC/YqgF family)